MARESWEAIAHRLAARLMYHAYCENDDVELNPNCPFCEDIAAYRAYVEKCEQANRLPVQTSSLIGNADTVTLEEALGWGARLKEDTTRGPDPKLGEHLDGCRIGGRHAAPCRDINADPIDPKDTP
jgi:hypothetical protein